MQRYKEKYCTVTMHGMVYSFEKYELLENVDGAARITWVSWNKYTQPPLGAVYANKMPIARYEIPTEEKSRYTHYIGTLSSTESFGIIVYANEVSEKGAKGMYRNRDFFLFFFLRLISVQQTVNIAGVELLKPE